MLSDGLVIVVAAAAAAAADAGLTTEIHRLLLNARTAGIVH
jgi:hypothetical protein